MSAKYPVWLGNNVGASYGNAAIGADDSQLPFSEVWLKVADGRTWQGQFDTRSPADVNAFRQMVETYRAQGIAVKPWMVVNGVGMGGESQAGMEAAVAIEAARAAGSNVIIVDLEPEEIDGTAHYYWRRALGANADRAREFLDACQQAGIQVWVAPDARPGRLDACDFATWAAHPALGIVLPQVYWTTFDVPWHDAIDRALGTLGGYAIDHTRVGIVMPGDASAEDFAGACDYAWNRGTLPPSLFQRGNLSADVVHTMQTTHSPWRDAFPVTDSEGVTPAAPQPGPAPDHAAALAQLQAAQGNLDAARDSIANAQRALQG